METAADAFARLAREVALAERLSYPLAELNDLLTAAAGADVETLPRPEIADAYRLNYVTAMVELAAHRTGILPPEWTATVMPLNRPAFIDPSLKLRAHLLTASPPPFRRRNIFIDSSLGDREATKDTAGRFEIYEDFTHLRVYSPHPEYLLGMKCLAMRLGEEFRDREDVAALLRILGIESVAAAEEVLGRYYPLDRYPIRARYILEDLLSPGV